MKTALLPLTLAATLVAGAASAATIQVMDYSPAAYDDVLDSGSFVTEDFETLGGDLGEGEVGSDFGTDVGTFNSLGGTGNGGTVRNLSGNTGTELALRDDNVYGRTNQSDGGEWFLDSNDTYGIGWDVETGSAFNTIAFTITDASEFSYLRITVDGVEQELTDGNRLSNGETELVVITLDDSVTSARVELENFNAYGGDTSKRNDGFSIDGVAVGLAPVPLPASLPLLAAGAGALVLLRRRRDKAAA